MNNQTKTQENVKKALAKQTLGLPLTPHAHLRKTAQIQYFKGLSCFFVFSHGVVCYQFKAI